MKKLFGLLVMLVVGITLVGCFDLGETSTLEITKAPSSTYVQNFNGEVNLAFKVDDIEYNVVWKSGDVDSVTVGTTTYDKSKLIADGITISGLDFSTVGTKVLVVRYGSLSAQFEYQVVGTTDVSGTGTASDPYIIYTAQQLIDKNTEGKLKNTSYKYFKIGADLDFAGKTLYAPVSYISIDGSKSLGGNYKILNLESRSLFENGNNVILKNIDFVDCVTLSTIIGKEFSSVSVENVNILGNSFSQYAGYFYKIIGDGASSFVNCTTYANLINNNAHGSCGGFIRYAESDTYFYNCKNYGYIQSMNSMTGGLVGAANTGLVTFNNCANYGEIKIYLPSQEQITDMENLKTTKPGLYTIIGSMYNKPENEMDWVTGKGVSKVEVKSNCITNNYSNVSTLLVANHSLNEVIDLATEVFLENYSLDNVATYKVTVVNTLAQGYYLENGELVSSVNNGSVIVYDSEFAATDLANNKLILPTKGDIIAILEKPYITEIDSDLTIGTSTVYSGIQTPGYNMYMNGVYRLASTALDTTHSVSVIGYTATGEVAYISVGSTTLN